MDHLAARPGRLTLGVAPEADRHVDGRGLVPHRRTGDDLASGGAPRKVLLAVDADDVVLDLARRFDSRKINPTLVFSTSEMLHCLDTESFAVVVIQTDAIDGSVAEVVERARGASDAPILLVGDVPAAIRTVADDYVLANHATGDIFRSAIALVELSRPVALPSPLKWGPLELDVGTREARWLGEVIELTSLQFRIMEILVLAGGDVVPTQDIARHVWGDSTSDDSERVVAHIRRVRRKIEPTPSRPRFIKRVRGEGYRLVAN